MTRLAKNSRKIFLTLAALAVQLSPPLYWLSDRRPPNAEPLHVAKAYFRAGYARNFDAAYGHISSLDRRAGNRADYIQAHGSFSGFALRLAKIFADQIEFRVIEQEIGAHRARYTVDYRVPATDEYAALLFNWDQDKLNALPRADQQRIIGGLEKIRKAKNTISVEGRETFDLVKEDGRWKIFLDWASKIKVSFDAALPANSAIEVEVLNRRLFAGMEPFQTNLKIRNRGQQEVVARIEHRIEPKETPEHLTMIACGFLRPLTLQPGEEREVSSAYLLDPGFPKNTALSITFAFNLASVPRNDSLRKKEGMPSRERVAR